MVRANCRLLTRSEDDSWDLAQEVLIRAYVALPRFRGQSSFRTWLWRIKSNHCFNYLDRWRVRSGEQSVPPSHSALRDRPAAAPPPDEALEKRETAVRVRTALDSLPDETRVALVLRDLDGLSYKEISEHLAVSIPAARMRVSRARAEFRARYRGHFEEAS
jgi:RNA polymerase sigma-70 factor (ECF subfamily)